jgi:hypothetical protein
MTLQQRKRIAANMPISGRGGKGQPTQSRRNAT